MNSLQALGICMGISFLTSTILLAAISRPLGDFIGKICPDGQSMGFWLRFTLVMLFLVPLFFSVSIGLPHPPALTSLEVGELLQRAVTATVVGALFAMLGMGIWVSSLARRAVSASLPNNQNKADV